MDFLALRELIKKWAPLIGLGFTAWYAYDYYFVFEKDAASALNLKRGELRTIKEQNRSFERKVQELEEFAKKLEQTKSDLAGLAKQLEDTKAVLEEVNIPGFLKMLVFESKRVGLTVLSLVPLQQQRKEYYVEYPIELKFRGVYAQLYSYLKRLTSLQSIIKVQKFDIKPISSSTAKYVELEGSLTLVTYAYSSSDADAVGSKISTSDASAKEAE